jgi:hypothetical protein
MYNIVIYSVLSYNTTLVLEVLKCYSQMSWKSRIYLGFDGVENL